MFSGYRTTETTALIIFNGRFLPICPPENPKEIPRKQLTFNFYTSTSENLRAFFSPSRIGSWTGSSHLPAGELLGERGGWGRSSWLVALHSSGSRPAFVWMAGASNPAFRIELDKMFGQARARQPLFHHHCTLAVPPPCKTCHTIHISQSHGWLSWMKPHSTPFMCAAFIKGLRNVAAHCSDNQGNEPIISSLRARDEEANMPTCLRIQVLASMLMACRIKG